MLLFFFFFSLFAKIHRHARAHAHVRILVNKLNIILLNGITCSLRPRKKLRCSPMFMECVDYFIPCPFPSFGSEAVVRIYYFHFNFLIIKSVDSTLASPWKIQFHFLQKKNREDCWQVCVCERTCVHACVCECKVCYSCACARLIFFGFFNFNSERYIFCMICMCVCFLLKFY